MVKLWLPEEDVRQRPGAVPAGGGPARLRTLRAATAHQNAASRKVLTKAGFVPVGLADLAHLAGKPGTRY